MTHFTVILLWNLPTLNLTHAQSKFHVLFTIILKTIVASSNRIITHSSWVSTPSIMVLCRDGAKNLSEGGWSIEQNSLVNQLFIILLKNFWKLRYQIFMELKYQQFFKLRSRFWIIFQINYMNEIFWYQCVLIHHS